MFDISFHGAARSVTGSCHMLHINGKRILLDCGLFQGKRMESFEKNQSFPFDPAEIDALVLSHAHIDHSGKIPMLVRLGFKGPIYCTHATRDLANIMLLDSAHIQEKDTVYVNRKRAKKGEEPVELIYGTEDVLNSLEQFRSIGYRNPTPIASGVNLTFYDAGHILGSAVVVIEIQQNGSQHRLCFTGDLGRPDRPILRDPEFVGDVDTLISESTYGGRRHLQTMEILDRLEDIIKRTVSRGGKIIVPAFSVGRTQELVYDLNMLATKGRLPELPIYVDSPLSVNATHIFRFHPQCMDTEARNLILQHNDPFGFESLHYVMHASDSKALNTRDEPMMIISSSGMCEAGRILHHLANNVEDPANTVLITGYCAAYTLGRRIVEKEPVVRIFGDTFNLRAEVKVLNSLSAHADGSELLSYHSQFDRKRLESIFLVHGDFDQQEKLKTGLDEELGYENIVIPEANSSHTV